MLAKHPFCGVMFFVHLLQISAVETGSIARGFRFSPAAAAAAGDFAAFLVSSSGEFAAGFLRDPRTGYFTLAVAGMDARSQLFLDTIWMANRDDPFRDTPELVFSGSILVTIHQKVQWDSSSSTTFSSSSSSSGGGDFVELSDSGNLRLVSRSSSSSSSDDQAAVVWQSFDRPTDTLLQGQNFTQAMRLVSSISAQDPRSGPYSLQLLGDRMLLLAGSEPYWTDAALRERDNGSSGSTIYMRIQPDGYIGLYQNEQTRVHFVPFSSLNRASANFTRRARLDPDGNLRVYYWQDGNMVEDYAALRDPCEFPDSCGSFGICSSELQNKSCKCPAGVTAAGNTSTALRPVDSRDAARGCRDDAAATDSCIDNASQSSPEDDFLVIQGVDYFAMRFAAAAFGPSTATLADCRAGCLANCSCKAFFFRNDSSACFHTDSMRSMLLSSNAHNLGFIRMSKTERSHHTARALQISMFVLAVLVAFTALAFGCYYRRSRRKDEHKAEDHHSDEEAFLDAIPGLPKRFPFSEIESAKNTRRISVVPLQGCSVREFQTELAAIARLGSHSNLVALLGYCIHGKKRYIIYDGSASGSRSLDEILKNPGRPALDWSATTKILLGIARGLAFLHANGGVHGDLVPSNVLLDHGESSSPRLARYGLAPLTGRPVPYASDDVRAFGAIVAALLDGGDGAPAEDQRLREIAWCCAQQEAVLRPSMAKVVETLSSIVLPKPSFGFEILGHGGGLNINPP